ncbi:MAG: hypothetical protein J6J17_04475 [Bacilli bacterium]|nr:hypothetical protein [Bacilli bacterium]
MDNSVIEKLKNYCLNHPELVQTGIIKGINSVDGKIVLERDGISKNISIEELENDSFDFENFELRNLVKNSVESQEEIEELDESTNTSFTNVIVQENIPTTLKEIQDCTLLKDEGLIDKALATFSIDEKTGNININKAIKIITDNSINNVVECLRNNKVLSTNLSDYDLKGKPIVVFENSSNKLDLEELINRSFDNILVYVEVAKLKNTIFTDKQIQNAKNKYRISINDKLNVLGLNNKDNKPAAASESSTSTNSVVKDIKPDTDIKRAGFADILILTIIILIYAAIIINLIMKLK